MRYPLLAFTLLVLASLACGLPNPLASKPTPQPTVPVSEEAAQRAGSKLQAAATQVAGGTVEMTLTEEELTSLVVYRLGDQLPLENPVIRLQDGRIRAEATMRIQGLSQQAVIIIVPAAVDGTLQLTVEEAKIGLLSVPKDVLDTILREIENAITNAQSVYIEDVRVENGTLSVRMQVQN